MIGILDSGIGGLSVYSEIVRLLPKEAICYYADSANCPYGERSDEDILVLSRACVKELVGRGCNIVVIACNTITSVAGAMLRQEFSDVAIVGMEPAIKPAAAGSKSKVVGVLATKATLAADKYHNTRDKFAKGVRVVEIVGEGLVEIVEGEMVESDYCEEVVGRYIELLAREGADSVVLGCTHYPFLKGVISKMSRGLIKGANGEDGITIIDPSAAVARRVKEVLKEIQGDDRGGGREIFLSSKEGESLRIERIAAELRLKSIGKKAL